MVWSNWSKNIQVGGGTIRPNIVMPSTLEELTRIVRRANREGKTVRAAGSHWSFSDCALTWDVIVETSNLNKIFAFSQGRSVFGHRDPGRPAAHGDESQVLPEALNNSVVVSTRKFAHIQAGIKIKDLYEALDNPANDNRTGRGRWALRTMGGASGQTVAGAISTGTHGSDFNLPPLSEMVRAIHLVAADGSQHWIERTGTGSITEPERLFRTFGGVIPRENIHYDNDFFNGILVSMGRMGIIYSFVIEVTSQFGLSEVVHETTWLDLKPHLESGAIFRGTDGFLWLNRHPRRLESGSLVVPRARGVSIFINPYRTSDNYATDTRPNRRVMLVTHATTAEGVFDSVRHTRSGGPGLIDKAALIAKFEHAGNLGDVRRVVDDVISMLRPASGTRGYPVAHSVLNTTSGSTEPVLSMECVVSTLGNAHVRYIDRMLQIIDEILRTNWERGNKIKFAGGFNLRFTGPSSALLGMQSLNGDRTMEKFCHIEIIIMKEIDIFGNVHSGQHNMESASELWLKAFEHAATEFGVRMHWGMLNQANRFRIERAYPLTLHRWRKVLTKLIGSGDSKSGTFDSWFSKRLGLEPYTEVLTGTSWGNNRYDLFGFNERGEVRQLWFNGRWNWSNLGNHFADGERFVGPLTATSWGNNRIDVFGLGKGGSILQLWWNGRWNWSNLHDQFPSVKLTGTLAAASPAPDRIELFGLAENGDVWRFWFDRRWRHENLGNRFAGGERFFGSLTAVSWGPNRTDLFGLGSKGQVIQVWRDGGNWNWSDLSEMFPSNVRYGGPITAATTGVHRIDVFGTGENGRLLRLKYEGRWTWEELGGAFPDMVTRFGMPHEFGDSPRSDDYYKLQERRANEQFAGPITAVSWGGARLDIFGFGESGNVLQLWRGDGALDPWNWSSLNNGWNVNKETVVDSMSITVRTGSDDLRRESQAVAFLRLSGGREITLSLNGRAGWAAGSVNTVQFPTRGIRLGDVELFGIRFTTGSTFFLDQPDKWDMTDIRVTFTGPSVSGSLLDLNGNPLVRFTTGREWSVPIRVPD